MARSRTNRAPALAVSALLHAGAIAAALIAWQTTKHLTIGSVVPVEIVNGPPADMAPAIQAPEPAPATSEENVPEATTPPTPQATPAPTPPTPAPAPPVHKQVTPPTPKPTPAPGKPTATATAKPAPTGQGKPAKGFNMDQLARSLASAKPAKKFSLSDLEASLRRNGRGAPGPNKARTAPVAQAGAGLTDRVSASDVNGLAAKLQQLWNPNCDVEGAAGINVKVLIHFGPGGSLSGAPELTDRSIDPLSSSLLGAAAHRALSAVVRGAPFTDMPPNFAGDVIVNFNAKQACARR